MVLINEEMLRAQAPSIFAEAPEENRVSSRYSFLSTMDILELLQEEGWNAHSASQVNPRKWSAEHAKHVVRCRHGDLDNFDEGDSIPELLLYNAHNGLGSYTLRAGIFVCVCSNGLVVAETDYGLVNTRHIGFEEETIKEASRQLVVSTSDLGEKINAWKGVELTDRARSDFFVDAAKLRFADPDEGLIRDISTPRRDADRGTSLWKNFNVAQENIIRGGFLNGSTRRRVRKITSIQKDMNLNSALWDLTSQYAEVAN
jgi:hypothetical protein